jgi:hypothetical protein
LARKRNENLWRTLSETLEVEQKSKAAGMSRPITPPAVLQLVENDSTHNNVAFNNLLLEGRHIHQVKGIVQHPDNQRTHNRACNCPDSTSRKGSTTDNRSRDAIKFVANAKPRLP